MRVIPLTKGYETIVDDDVADLIQALGWTWFARVDKRTGTVYAGKSASRLLGRPRVIHLHRWVLGAEPDVLVDHRDGNGLHNRRDNIRVATQSQNHANSITTGSVCGFRGVTPHRKGFQAQIRADGRYQYLGMYSAPEEAHAVYCAKRIELFGEFSPDVCR